MGSSRTLIHRQESTPPTLAHTHTEGRRRRYGTHSRDRTSPYFHNKQMGCMVGWLNFRAASKSQIADSDSHRSVFVSTNQCYLYCGRGKVYPRYILQHIFSPEPRSPIPDPLCQTPSSSRIRPLGHRSAWRLSTRLPTAVQLRGLHCIQFAEQREKCRALSCRCIRGAESRN